MRALDAEIDSYRKPSRFQARLAPTRASNTCGPASPIGTRCLSAEVTRADRNRANRRTLLSLDSFATVMAWLPPPRRRRGCAEHLDFAARSRYAATAPDIVWGQHELRGSTPVPSRHRLFDARGARAGILCHCNCSVATRRRMTSSAVKSYP
jgi:hypothetical protein